MYGETVLGATEEAVNMFFKNPSNKAIFDMIRDDVYPEYIRTKVEDMEKLKDIEMSDADVPSEEALKENKKVKNK